ncbi:UvrD-helicase domain-containing protein [Paenibacillus sp. NFR01]|uniref:UvrD-helicase domain-containing protein n=1 Tax=Paenibacillus sp. NFR01 TaxID=1566279 RepID=UPI0008C4BCF7|nr:UvrD-helicase domain-containing protein [Paenibacillus sp. NFR01]SEU23624.1 DNA helicase-2 / ATP-dependent DNA helicase PcrA [Paenibacillus sp. NFR01]
MNKLIFQHIPAGAAGEQIPRAAVAAERTSRDSVSAGAEDAAYFRRLEAAGILLNPPQIAAVRHHEGPLLTLAGAGSGKTSVLICRTGYLLAVRGISPSRLLLLTFSSKAAAEMRERIALLPGVTSAEAGRLQARTFHSFFLYFLRRQGVRQDIFSDTRRQHIVLKQIMREFGLPKDAYPPETLLALLSGCKMNIGEPADLPEATPGEQEMKAVLLRYEEWKNEQFKIDFDDVLLLAYRMLKAQPRLLEELQTQFQYVMVDEFQDTNALQYELVRMLAQPHNNLMVVGDDDQTIYSFNGARSEFILDFDKQYPGAKVVTLDINYRSGPAIVGLGNGIIRHNRRRLSKTLQAAVSGGCKPRYMRPQTADEEAELILNHIVDKVGQSDRAYRDYALLYRSSSSNRALLEQLLLRDIPYIDYGEGQLIYEHWLIVPVLDHLRLAMNRRNFTAMESILPTLYISREAGMEHIRRMEAAQPKQGPLIHLTTLPGMAEFKVAKLRERLELIRALAALTPVQAIRRIRGDFYDHFIEASERHQATLHREMLNEMLDELETSAERFADIPAFLDFIGMLAERNQASRRQGQEEQGDRIALMTIHKSKGLEFPVVFLIGASEGILPHSSALEALRPKERKKGRSVVVIDGKAAGDGASAGDSKEAGFAALEEERRLAYVAVTRAREELYISSPAQHRGRKAEVSRFMLSAFRPETPAGTGSSPAGAAAGGAAGRIAFHSDAEPRTRGFARASMSSPGTAATGEHRRREHGGGAAAPARTHTVPVWACTGAACPGWTRIKPGGADDRLAAKPCPLCAAPMERSTREVPV